jgi:hypothetical protein
MRERGVLTMPEETAVVNEPPCIFCPRSADYFVMDAISIRACRECLPEAIATLDGDVRVVEIDTCGGGVPTNEVVQ